MLLSVLSMESTFVWNTISIVILKNDLITLEPTFQVLGVAEVAGTIGADHNGHLCTLIFYCF